MIFWIFPDVLCHAFCMWHLASLWYNLVPRVFSLSWVRRTQDRDKALGTRLALVMQNVNFIMSQFPEFPNQSRWKEYPRENNTRAQTRLGGEFWACDVIAHKTKLDLSFICGHNHLHLVDYRPINQSLHYLLHRADQTQQGNSWLSVGTLSCRCPVKLFT